MIRNNFGLRYVANSNAGSFFHERSNQYIPYFLNFSEWDNYCSRLSIFEQKRLAEHIAMEGYSYIFALKDDGSIVINVALLLTVIEGEEVIEGIMK